MPRILVIEDEAGIREVIADILTYEYYDVELAADGAEGVQKAVANPPDLVICDIMMPVMNGHEVLKQLRELPVTQSTPFIYLSAIDERSNIRDSMNLGADDYLIKPVKPQELLRTVSVRLAYHRQLQADAERGYEQMKQQLARIATHELRTPLIAARTTLNILERQQYSVNPQELQNLMQRMNASISRLQHRVEQLVYLTQLDAGLISPDETVNGVSIELWSTVMGASTQALRFLTQPSAEGRLKLVAADNGLTILGNPMVLRHALAEVIANALSFSPPDSEVRIVQRRIEGQARITVTDFGRGIPPDQIDTALKAFVQINRGDHEQQGLGLGLALAQRLIQVHRGTLEIRSVVGRGTRVVILLPLAPAT